jgi:3-oxoacyl-[acyl-carrier protein] reductase
MALARAGVRVAICGRDEGTLAKAADHVRAETGAEVLPVRADLSARADVVRLAETVASEWGGADILVVNSGGPPAGSFFELQQADWDAAYDSTLAYVLELYRRFLPGMKARRWGRIINILSLTAKEPSESLLLSSVFRSGVASLAKALSRELIPHGITVNNVCPGAFRTERAIALMEGRAAKSGKTVAEVERETEQALPMGRFQEPGELADLVVFLASAPAGGLTGATIQMDGGYSRGLY